VDVHSLLSGGRALQEQIFVEPQKQDVAVGSGTERCSRIRIDSYNGASCGRVEPEGWSSKPSTSGPSAKASKPTLSIPSLVRTSEGNANDRPLGDAGFWGLLAVTLSRFPATVTIRSAAGTALSGH
jgi:hypothetical protein